MSEADTTAMGGEGKSFQTTYWPEIRDAKSSAESRRKEIIGKLLTRYWKPVYCYLRRKGYNNEQAKDLTQGFFHEIVLGRDLIQRSEEAKGRFRTFLLTALDRYVVSVYQHDTAKKRAPRSVILRLETPELPDLPAAQKEARPDQLFHYAWAVELLDQVIAKVKEECLGTNKGIHWEVFRAKVLAPVFENVPSPSLKEVCAKYGVENEAKASNMIVTVKRRFRLLLRRFLRQFVQSESEIEREFVELLEILSKSGAR